MFVILIVVVNESTTVAFVFVDVTIVATDLSFVPVVVGGGFVVVGCDSVVVGSKKQFYFIDYLVNDRL